MLFSPASTPVPNSPWEAWPVSLATAAAADREVGLRAVAVVVAVVVVVVVVGGGWARPELGARGKRDALPSSPRGRPAGLDEPEAIADSRSEPDACELAALGAAAVLVVVVVVVVVGAVFG